MFSKVIPGKYCVRAELLPTVMLLAAHSVASHSKLKKDKILNSHETKAQKQACLNLELTLINLKFEQR